MTAKARLADEEFDSRLDETYLAVNVYRQPLYPQSIGQWLTFYERKWDIYSPSGFAHRPEFCCRRSGILSCLPSPHTDGMYGDRRIRIFLLDHIESLFDTAQHFHTSLFVLESDGKTESRLSRRAITFR